jgi:hypothetical protein
VLLIREFIPSHRITHACKICKEEFKKESLLARLRTGSRQEAIFQRKLQKEEERQEIRGQVAQSKFALKP